MLRSSLALTSLFSDIATLITHRYVSEVCHLQGCSIQSRDGWDLNKTDVDIESVRDWRGLCFEKVGCKSMIEVSESKLAKIGALFQYCKTIGRNSAQNLILKKKFKFVCTTLTHIKQVWSVWHKLSKFYCINMLHIKQVERRSNHTLL